MFLFFNLLATEMAQSYEIIAPRVHQAPKASKGKDTEQPMADELPKSKQIPGAAHLLRLLPFGVAHEISQVRSTRAKHKPVTLN